MIWRNSARLLKFTSHARIDLQLQLRYNLRALLSCARRARMGVTDCAQVLAARGKRERGIQAARRNGLRATGKNERYRMRVSIKARNCKTPRHKRTGAMEKITIRTDTNHILRDGYKFRKDRTLADGSKSFRCCTRNSSGRFKLRLNS